MQLHVQDVQPRTEGARVRADWRGRSARILHFSGAGRRKLPEWRGLFARVANPLAAPRDAAPAPAGGLGDDAYAEFLAALRAWVARRGLDALARSLYGTTDARTGRVRDPSTLPLLALLHYLLRANGCVRVVEAGTGRGVSTACIASAVAHRPGGRVVTYDPHRPPERAELWESLPEAMRACIEPHAGGAVEGMTAALAAGARFDAALLDSMHAEEQLWAEFQLARQLVCAGGLILVHAVRPPGSAAGQALQRIEAAGYGVTRLWTAECGVAEDDGLGFAVIENRLRAGASPGDVRDEPPPPPAPVE